MPIRGSPNGAGYLRPQAGRDRPESVVAINRNGWSQSIGMAGRDRPVRAAFEPGFFEPKSPLRTGARQSQGRASPVSERHRRRPMLR